MSLIRGNRRSVSKQNSLIEPIEESKGEQDIFRNDVGEYIEPVPEEETFNQTHPYSEESGSISLDDLGGEKQSPPTGNDSDDEEFFERSRKRKQIAKEPIRRTSEPSERPQLWKEDTDQFEKHDFDVVEEKDMRRTEQPERQDLFAQSPSERLEPQDVDIGKKAKERKRDRVQ